MSTSITKVKGREVLDSRGNPTVEAEVFLSDGSHGRAIVPSGASKGQREALELRDGDKKRYLGKGVLSAVDNINGNIAKVLQGRKITEQKVLDKYLLEMDDTEQKEKLGANTMLGVSLAFAHAAAQSRKMPLYAWLNEMMDLGASSMKMPIPMMNIINGGLHANNGLEFQEFMVIPHLFPSFAEALRAGVEVFQTLKKNLEENHLSTGVGDEGGFAPELKNIEAAMDLIAESVGQAGYQLGKNVSIGLDCAASSFYDEETEMYKLRHKGATTLSREDLMHFYGDLAKKYPIVSIEDGLQENDWQGWWELTQRFGNDMQLVGDDLFVTQAKWVKKGIEEKTANAVLIKVNQVGTLAETFDTMALCREKKYGAVVSHRSGETEDTTIAHLAVASGCGQIKTGSLSRSERVAKYNELLRIEEWAKEQGKTIPFAHETLPRRHEVRG